MTRRQTSAFPALPARLPARPLGWLRAFGARLVDWLRTAAAYYDAAGRYEELSRLPDAELARRGLARDTLARDLCEDCESQLEKSRDA